MIVKEIDVEIKQCEGTEIYLFRNFLNMEQCQHIIGQYAGIIENQCIVDKPDLSRFIWDCIKDKITALTFFDKKRNGHFKISGFKSLITVTKSYTPLQRHRDQKNEGELFKMFFYLNKISNNGGTDFFDNGQLSVSVGNETGAGVLFDIDIEHASQNFSHSERKYLAGVRPIIQYL